MRMPITVRAVVITAAACLALSACTSADSTGRTGTTAEKGKPGAGKTLSYVQQVTADAVNFAIACGVRKRAKELGYHATVDAPQSFDAPTQTSTVNAVAARRPDALLLSPVDAAAMYAPMKRAQSSGIKTGTVLTYLNDKQAAPLLATADYVEFGRIQARELAKRLKNKPGAKVALLRYPPGKSSATDDMAKGLTEEIHKYPKLDYVGQQIVQIDPGSSTSQLNALLARYPDLQGVVSNFPASTVGAATALRQRHLGDKVIHVGGGATNTVLPSLKSGLVDVTVTANFVDMGERAVDGMSKLVTGKSAGRTQMLRPVVVTAANMNDPAVSAALTLDTKTCPQ